MYYNIIVPDGSNNGLAENSTLLGEIQQSIIDGFPGGEGSQGGFDQGGLKSLKYAFIFSMWRVTYFGAVKAPDQLQNTFQIVLATDGTHSLMINNYQLLEWSQA